MLTLADLCNRRGKTCVIVGGAIQSHFRFPECFYIRHVRDVDNTRSQQSRLSRKMISDMKSKEGTGFCIPACLLPEAIQQQRFARFESAEKCIAHHPTCIICTTTGPSLMACFVHIIYPYLSTLGDMYIYSIYFYFFYFSQVLSGSKTS